MSRASWGIVMTVDEPSILIKANIAWHLSQGASAIYVYFDNKFDEGADELRGIPEVHVRRCTWKYWKERGQKHMRPRVHRRRQVINANDALDRAECDFLFHIDADEFLYQTGDLSAELAAIKPLDCAFFVPVWERLHDPDSESIFDGGFRAPITGRNGRLEAEHVLRTLYGNEAQFLFQGLAGHAAGKCAAPTGKDFSLNLHWTSRKGVLGRAPRWASTSTRLLHFDGLTAHHWAEKLKFKAEYRPEEAVYPPHRQAQMDAIAACDGDRSMEAAVYLRVKSISARQVEQLEALGLYEELDFDPFEGEKTWLKRGPDLSPAAFDAAIKARKYQLSAAMASARSMAPS